MKEQVKKKKKKKRTGEEEEMSDKIMGCYGLSNGY